MKCENCGSHDIKIVNPIEIVVGFKPSQHIVDRLDEFKADMLNPEMSDLEIGNKWKITQKELRRLAQFYKLYIPDNMPIKDEGKTGKKTKDTIYVFA